MQTDDIRPATPDEVTDTLAHALCYDGRKRTHDGDRLMARIVAERLVSHLARSGFLLMKTPPGDSAASYLGKLNRSEA